MGTDLQRSPDPTGALAEAMARAQSLEDVAGLLRALRRRHARAQRDSALTYRELAQRTGWSQTAIAEYFTARTLPPTDRFDALLEVLGAAPGELRALADARDRVEENQRQAKTRRFARPAAPSELGPTPSAEREPGRPTAVPRQLPADTALFTGRDQELGSLLDLAERTVAGVVPGAVVISAIDGMGGMGKTALAVHTGHRLAEQFPDGQLFLDLYGFTQDTAPRDPGDALAGLLGALGVPPGQVPAQVDARAALYRERLAGTRTLVVLDNASDEAQVRPLLPAASGCLVLVTSRRRLKALDDAVPLPLDVLAHGEAVELLRQAARVRDDPADADETGWGQVAELCGRLPLALVIAGALLRTGGKAWTLARLIDRLSPRRAGDELAGYTDDTRSLAAVFDLSYQFLPEDERLLFRRLGLLPGSEIDAYAAAALLGTDLDAADLLVQRLSDHSLLIGASPGRYRVHDLIRAHAGTLATRLDPESERTAAVDRLLYYYAHTAQSASQSIARWPRPAPSGPAHAPDLTQPDTARAWLRTEHPNLDAAHAHASTHGLDHHVIALAAGLAEILRTDGPWARALHIHNIAAHTAEHQGQPADHATALTNLGRVRFMTGDFPGAVDSLNQALEIFRVLGDRHGEAIALTDLGRVWCLTRDYPGAVDALNRALEISRTLGNRYGEATALTDLGRVWCLTGDHPGAVDSLNRALEISHTLGNRRGEASALHNLGCVRYLTGDYPGAVDALTRALEICRALGDRHGEASALHNVGPVRQVTGDYPGAIDAHTRALEIFRALGNRHGEASALNELGRVRLVTGDYPGAIDAHTRALEVCRALGSRGDEAAALNYYAAALAASGRRPRALALFRQALAVHRELNKPDDEAISLEGIGEHHLADGDPTQGTTHLRQALEIYQRLGMRADADRVQTRLDTVPRSESRGR